MLLEGMVHCEAPDCQAHSHVGPDTMEKGRLPISWVVVRFFDGNGAIVEHAFDSANCALKWLAQVPPPEEI